MNFADFLDAQAATAFDALATFEREAAVTRGHSTQQASDWERLHKVYYGATKFTAKQREARTKAVRSGLTLDQLTLIERYLGRITEAAEVWRLRLTLLDFRGDYEALRRKAKALVPVSRPKPKTGVVIGRSIEGLRSIKITGPERDIAELQHALEEGIDGDVPTPPSEQMLEAFLELLRSDAEGLGVPRSTPQPLILVPVPDYAKIVRGDGDDIILGLTDGTTMTGAQFLNEVYAKLIDGHTDLLAALFHRVEGPLDLYRSCRFADDKQRTLLRATMPVCPFPGCKHAADSCEFHHITPWKHGGETNLSNLSPLCRYHNRINDDDPHQLKRGRIVSHSGVPIWRSPRGHLVPNYSHNNYRFGAMQQLFDPA